MKSKKMVRIIIAIPVIFVIALAFLYVLTLFSNENDRRWLEIRPKHSLAKFSELKDGMNFLESFELLGMPTISEGCCNITHLYKIDRGWVFSSNRRHITDYANDRVFKLEHEEYSTAASYLRGTGSFTDGRDDRPKHSLAKFSKVKIGMSPAKVVKLAGKPTDSVDSSFIWYRYKIDTGWYMDLHFFNEKLSDMSIVDFPNNRVFELEQEDYITTLPCPSAVARTNDSSDSGTFIDDRDGKAYRTVKVGTLTWMAENLNFAADSSVCLDNDESNCQKYGRLYNWETAMKACPAGWRLSSDEDWVSLALAVAGKCNGRVHWKILLKKLKTTTGWRGENGTDEIGFSALPGGFSWSDGEFLSSGGYGSWWSATEAEGDATSAKIWEIASYSYGRESDDKMHLRSVRCVRE